QVSGDGSTLEEGHCIVLEVTKIQPGQPWRVFANKRLEDRGTTVRTAGYTPLCEHLVDAADQHVGHFLSALSRFPCSNDLQGRNPRCRRQGFGVECARMGHHPITVPVQVSLGLEYLHDLPPAYHGPSVESAGHHLCQRGHIWDDVKILLR